MPHTIRRITAFALFAGILAAVSACGTVNLTGPEPASEEIAEETEQVAEEEENTADALAESSRDEETDEGPYLNTSGPENADTDDSVPEYDDDSPLIGTGDENVGVYYVELAGQAYEQVPEWVRTLFEQNGWRINIRSGYFGAPYGYNVPLKGLTIPEEKTILLANKDNCCDVQTMCHEMGHFIDCIYGWPSTTPEFVTIYGNEYQAFSEYYGYSNLYESHYELFAEGLYHLWTNPGDLEFIAPETYTYLVTNINP